MFSKNAVATIRDNKFTMVLNSFSAMRPFVTSKQKSKKFPFLASHFSQYFTFYCYLLTYFHGSRREVSLLHTHTHTHTYTHTHTHTHKEKEKKNYLYNLKRSGDCQEAWRFVGSNNNIGLGTEGVSLGVVTPRRGQLFF